jgi:hypothetical protein
VMAYEVSGIIVILRASQLMLLNSNVLYKNSFTGSIRKQVNIVNNGLGWVGFHLANPFNNYKQKFINNTYEK